VAGPPHGRSHRRGAARPPHPRRGRFRLRRRGAEEAAGRRDLDHPAAQGRRPARAPARPHRPPRSAPDQGRPAPLPRQAPRYYGVHAPVTRYGKAATISAATVTCLWPSVFGTRHVTVVLIRDRSAAGHDLALVITDTVATAAQLIERYASRWSIKVAVEDARQVFGAGQARNRTARAVERTVPFQLACQAVTTCWYATAGHNPAEVADHRAPRPGTRRRPSLRPPTWPPSSAASSSPPDLRHLALTSRHPKKSASCAWPGRTQRHNYESRVTPVPRVLLFISLAGPAPSRSADTSRLCQGCFPPSLAPPGSGCPQLQTPAATGREQCLIPVDLPGKGMRRVNLPG
jgi:hypothetical protein